MIEDVSKLNGMLAVMPVTRRCHYAQHMCSASMPKPLQIPKCYALMQVVGEYHLGEFVNRFRAGSLVMKLPDSEAAAIPTQLFGTINGVIGLVASLPQSQFDFLTKLQAQSFPG